MARDLNIELTDTTPSPFDPQYAGGGWIDAMLGLSSLYCKIQLGNTQFLRSIDHLVPYF